MNVLKTLSTLSGQDIKSYINPQHITEPGFYMNGHNIEHWSFPCQFTQALTHVFKNESGLIPDGYISMLGNDDVEQVANQVHNWAKHLKKHGVIK